MLKFKRRAGESFYIHPNDDLPPGMTVEELFKDGSIKVLVSDHSSKQVTIGVEAPKGLNIAKEELVGRCT